MPPMRGMECTIFDYNVRVLPFLFLLCHLFLYSPADIFIYFFGLILFIYSECSLSALPLLLRCFVRLQISHHILHFFSSIVILSKFPVLIFIFLCVIVIFLSSSPPSSFSFFSILPLDKHGEHRVGKMDGPPVD